jgi:hypothetical protein
MSTAPAATMMVLREHNSSGSLTDTIVAVVALNKVVVLVVFSIVATIISLGQGLDGSNAVVALVGESPARSRGPMGLTCLFGKPA